MVLQGHVQHLPSDGGRISRKGVAAFNQQVEQTLQRYELSQLSITYSITSRDDTTNVVLAGPLNSEWMMRRFPQAVAVYLATGQCDFSCNDPSAYHHRIVAGPSMPWDSEIGPVYLNIIHDCDVVISQVIADIIQGGRAFMKDAFTVKSSRWENFR